MKTVRPFRDAVRDKLFELVSPNSANVLLLVVTALVVSALMTSLVSQLEQRLDYTQGQIAEQTVRAPYDLVVEDALSTEKRRADALANVHPVFTANANRDTETSAYLSLLFSSIRESSEATVGAQATLSLTPEKRLDIERKYRFNLEGDEWSTILDPTNWPKLESAVMSIVQPLVTTGIIGDKQELRAALQKGAVTLREKGLAREKDLHTESSLFDLNEALTRARIEFPEHGFGHGPAFDSVVRKLALVTLQPNVMFDVEETEQRLKDAEEKVEASVLKIQRGQVLVREGDLVTPSQEAILSQFNKERRPAKLVRMFIGHVVLSITLMLCTYFFAANYWPGFRPLTRDLVSIATTLAGTLLAVKIFYVLSGPLSLTYPSIDTDTLLLATPVAAGGVLLQVILGGPAVLGFTVSLALVTALFLDHSWLMLLFITCGNFVGAVSTKSCARRSTFIYAGVRIAGINVLLVGCYLLLYPEVSGTDAAARVLLAACGGLFSGILAGGLTPFAEFFGGYITDIKLLELASLDRPLLRELSLQAPGTWNHSMVMGQIAEAAAEAVGANALLARVGAYYHDIGKIKKPAYFVENQTDRDNRHDKLTPSMSALIIKSHVKDGIELALEHSLPRLLVDFIPQHHGNSLIEYFYEKAMREAEPNEIVDQAHYRYPGPRPQTKVAGILMLADSVEAASRTLSDPSPAKIQGLVQKIINKVFASGELDECDLTLQDLHLIAKSFTRVLTGIYHRRVEYSEPAEKIREGRPKGKANEGESPEAGDPNRAAHSGEGSLHCQDTISPHGAQDKSEEPLKRLGMH